MGQENISTLLPSSTLQSEIEATSVIETTYKGPPLHMAVDSGNLKEVERLINENPELINIQDEYCDTALHIAVLKEHQALVSILLNANANPDIQDFFGNTALHIAAQTGDQALVSILLNSNSNSDLQNTSGNTALHIAVLKEHQALVSILLNPNTNPDIQRGDRGYTALHLAAQEGKHEIVSILLNTHANPDIQDEFGFTALHLAAQEGKHEIVSILLNTHANPDIQDKFGFTALHLAAQEGKHEVASILLKAKADHTILQGLGGYTALHLAVEYNHPLAVKEFINAPGVDLDFKHRHYDTALHLAILKDRPQCIIELIKAGANMRDINIMEQTPLDIAYEKVSVVAIGYWLVYDKTSKLSDLPQEFMQQHYSELQVSYGHALSEKYQPIVNIREDGRLQDAIKAASQSYAKEVITPHPQNVWSLKALCMKVLLQQNILEQLAEKTLACTVEETSCSTELSLKPMGDMQVAIEE